MVIVIAIIIIIVIMIIIISNYRFSQTQAMQTKFFIESPPLAGIFAECEWMDWINKETMMMAMMIVMMYMMICTGEWMDWISEEYPNKHRCKEMTNKVRKENRKSKQSKQGKRKNLPKQTQDWARMGTEDRGKRKPI